MEDLESAINVFHETIAECREKLKGTLKIAFSYFFEKHPQCVALRWAQYTPFFNDGDPCVFHLHEVEYKLVGDEEFLCEWDREDHEDDHDVEDFCDMISRAPREVFLSMFGDHAWVIASKDGFEVQSYEDHD